MSGLDDALESAVIRAIEPERPSYYRDVQIISQALCSAPCSDGCLCKAGIIGHCLAVGVWGDLALAVALALRK